MAVIHDVMPAFELAQPTSVDDAVAFVNGRERPVVAGRGEAGWFHVCVCV